MRSPFLLMIAAVAVLVSGCGSNELIGEEVPNTPPDTQVEATPPNLDATSFTIDLYWSGSDPDGRVEYYEWVVTSNGEDNVFSAADTTGADKWNKTFVSDSTFVVSADIADFPDDIENPQLDDPEVIRFWQTHTFVIRAVDDRGVADPTPATVSFTATTLTPRIKVVEPNFPLATTCSQGPLALSFRWEATDPDNADGGPDAVRYVLLEWGGPADLCLTDVTYGREEPIKNLPESAWGPWIPYDAGEDSGTVKRYPILEQPEGTSFLFAVQARDVAGAVTPVFTFGDNVIHVKTTSQKFPLLTVAESNLGTVSNLNGKGNIQEFDIVAGQPLDFEWSADASNYGGLVDGYRWGFNVADPENEEDPGWAVPWGQWTEAARPTGFAQGAPTFVVQVRDNSGSVTRLLYQFQVIQVKARKDQRPLLLIDDSDERNKPSIDSLFDSQWESNLVGVQDFSTASDVVDIIDTGSRLSFAQINNYRALIWLVSSDDRSFYSRFQPESAERAPFNWLDIYQKFVGNVMLVGPRAMNKALDSSLNLITPIVLNTSLFSPQGLGVTENAQGQLVNVGTIRYPYTAWCLESVDTVFSSNPGSLNNSRLRTLGCDSYTYARVSQQYVERYRPSPSRVGNLYPQEVRTRIGDPDVSESIRFLFAELSMGSEEFYDVNAANRAGITLTVRDCQVPMYEAIARMDVDNVEIMEPLDLDEDYRIDTQERLVSNTTNDDGETVKDCPAVTIQNRQTSSVTGASIVIASTQYTDTKQNGSVPFEDYLWGFNPLSFQRTEVKAAVEWILLNQWGLNEE